jgi:hypothetical protein
MNNYKNILIAVLTGFLALSLFTQPAQSAPKTYDAVRLAEYTMCLNANANWQIASMQVNGGNGSLAPFENIRNCKTYKP